MKNVLIIQRIVAPYRVPFYQQLGAMLTRKGIRLTVVYGQPAPREREPVGELNAYAERVSSVYLPLGDRFFVYVPAVARARRADLVVVQQANKNLTNLALHLLRPLSGYKLAYWGHGKNFQARDKQGWEEAWKSFISRRVDYWFAYTEMSKRVIVDMGFPEERVMAIHNAIDTQTVRQELADVTDSEKSELRRKLGIPRDAPVAIFCSRVYREKRIEFFLNACVALRAKHPDFHVIVVGDGPERAAVAAFAACHKEWFHWMGAQYGATKAALFAISHVQLMPGLVGLHVVESFALLSPLVTTEFPYHSPEIEYLRSNINGMITPNNLNEFVSGASRVITDAALRSRLVAGCRRSRDLYTIDRMASCFCNGVLRALEM